MLRSLIASGSNRGKFVIAIHRFIHGYIYLYFDVGTPKWPIMAQ